MLILPFLTLYVYISIQLVNNYTKVSREKNKKNKKKKHIGQKEDRGFYTTQTFVAADLAFKEEKKAWYTVHVFNLNSNISEKINVFNNYCPSSSDV